MGLAFSVRGEGALALLAPADERGLPDAATRQRIVAAAREAGFASVSVELREGPPTAGP